MPPLVSLTSEMYQIGNMCVVQYKALQSAYEIVDQAHTGQQGAGVGPPG